MFDIELAYPFTLGLVAAFNPCGFAMLPVYVSFFLGQSSGDDTNRTRNMLRAIKVSLVLTAGFLAVFGSFGILTATLLSQGSVLEYTPYVTLGIGVLLVPLGIAMAFFGFELKVATPRLERGGDSGEIWSMFLFGVSYAVVSLGCTIGVFIAGVSSIFTSEGLFDGVAVFIAYALGMGAVITTLTLGVASARTSVATNMRKILPWVNRISGVLMGLAGAYLVVYGWWEIQVFRGNASHNALVSFFQDVETAIRQWMFDTGESRLGAGLLIIIALVLLRALWSEMGEQTRWAAAGGLGVVWLLLEFVKVWSGERANLFVLPLLRTIIGFPARIANWFSDPIRWGVLGELLVLAVIGMTVWFRFRRSADSTDPTDPATSTLAST